MQKKTLFLFSGVALLAAAGLIALLSSASPEKKEAPARQTTCCQKSIQKCSETNKNTDPGVMIMENLSRQFISIGF